MDLHQLKIRTKGSRIPEFGILVKDPVFRIPGSGIPAHNNLVELDSKTTLPPHAVPSNQLRYTSAPAALLLVMKTTPVI